MKSLAQATFGRRCALSLALLWAAAVVGCAGLGAGPMAGSAASRDLRTASDLTDVERRARVRLELASAYFAQGQLETALDEIKQALATFPEMPDGLNLRGLIYAGLGQPALAEDSFDRALALAPNDGNILHNQGWFQCQQARYDMAERSFNRALSQPNYRDASKTLLARGVCEAQSGRLPEAAATLRGAYEREPGNPALGTNLADVLLRLGRAEQAAFYIRRVNAQPAWSNAQTLWLGARIERRLGQQDAAQALVQRLRAQYPNSPEALAAEGGVQQ